MYVSNFTPNDYDKITDLNVTNNCTDNENNIDINIPRLLLTIPCSLSFFCFMSLMVYTIIQTFFNNK